MSALVIAGKPTPEDWIAINKAWAEIQQQYTDAIADNETKMVIKAQAQQDSLLSKINMFNTLHTHMRKYYCKEFCVEMNLLLGTQFNFDPSDKPAYFKLLDRCFNRAKAFKVDYELLTNKLAGLLSKVETAIAPTREYYYGILIMLSDHAKFAIADSITVWQYCERVRQYNLYCKKVEQDIANAR